MITSRSAATIVSNPVLGNSTSAPEYWASCGHMHPWGVACSLSAAPRPVYEPFQRTFGPCTKCDGADILVQYHDGKHHCADCRRGGVIRASCKHSVECGAKGRAGQHLRVHCRRCQYGWIEKIGSERERPK